MKWYTPRAIGLPGVAVVVGAPVGVAVGDFVCVTVAAAVGAYVVGAFAVGTFVVGADVGAFVVGTFVVGADVGALLIIELRLAEVNVGFCVMPSKPIYSQYCAVYIYSV